MFHIHHNDNSKNNSSFDGKTMGNDLYKLFSNSVSSASPGSSSVLEMRDVDEIESEEVEQAVSGVKHISKINGAEKLEFIAIAVSVVLLGLVGVAAAAVNNVAVALVCVVIIAIMIAIVSSQLISKFIIPLVMSDEQLKAISKAFQDLFNKCTNSNLSISVSSENKKAGNGDSEILVSLDHIPPDPWKEMTKLEKAYCK